LVLEWVEDDETNVEKLREKVALGFGDGKAVPGKKRKLVMNDGEQQVEED
jgi:multiple RNA-binding domain-containing protein 1